MNDLEDLKCKEFVKSAKLWRSSAWLMPLVRNLQAPGGSLQWIIQGHRDTITCLALTSDSKKAISASHDRHHNNWDIKVWDLEFGREMFTLIGHIGLVNSLVISPDGSIAVSASNDKTIKIWDLRTGEELKSLQGHKEVVRDIVMSSDGCRLISASKDNTLKIWDLKEGIELSTIIGSKGSMHSIDVTADWTTAISTSKESSFRFDVWDLQKKTLVRSIATAGDESKWAVTPDCSRAIVGTTYGRIWEVNLFQHEWSILRDASPWGIGVTSVAINSEGQIAAAAIADGTIGIYDLVNSRWLRWLVSPVTVGILVLGADGRTMLSGSNDGIIQFWDLSIESNNVTPYSAHYGAITALTMDLQGLSIASASSATNQQPYEAGEIKLWSTKTFQVYKSLAKQPWVWIRTMAFNRSGNKLAVGVAKQCADDGSPLLKPGETTCQVILFDLEHGQEVRIFDTGNVSDVGFTYNGNVISLSDQSDINIWKWEGGSEMRTSTLHKGWTRHLLSVLQDGKNAVFRLKKNKVNLCELDFDEKVPVLLKNLCCHGFAIGPNGYLAITFGPMDSLTVWNVENGEQRHILLNFAGGIRDFVITSDLQLGISCGVDKVLRIWELNKGFEICKFSGEVPFNCISTSPNNMMVVAGDENGCVHFFKLILPKDQN